MNNFRVILENAIWNLFNRPTWIDFIDILLVTFIIYNIILIIKETSASALVIGILLLIVATIISNLIGMKSLSWFLDGVLNNGVIVMVILFKTEIRKAIEQIGLVAFKENYRKTNVSNEAFIVENIARACVNLSKRRVGALIVFEQKMSINDIVQTGIFIDSEISSQIIENIFEPNTPLHDGAVIIRGNRIVAASCILSLSQNAKISKELGTRHRAALGITENSDAIALIVSEETGVISIAEKGNLHRHIDKEQLVEKLNTLYVNKEVNALKAIFSKVITGNSKHEN